jgi:hypothetical protein
MRSAVLLLFLSAAALLLPFSCGDGAQPSDRLTVTDKTPVIDGSVAADEYSFTQDFTNSTLYAARNNDTVTLAFKAGVTGWVAIGTGSTVMDMAASGILNLAMKEENNATTLEVALRADTLIKPGQTELPLILAYSTQDSFMVRHSFRTTVVLQLQ